MERPLSPSRHFGMTGVKDVLSLHTMKNWTGYQHNLRMHAGMAKVNRVWISQQWCHITTDKHSLMGTGHGDGLIKAVAKAKKIVNVLAKCHSSLEEVEVLQVSTNNTAKGVLGCKKGTGGRVWAVIGRRDREMMHRLAERKIPTRFQGLRHCQSVAENVPPLGIEYPGLDYHGQGSISLRYQNVNRERALPALKNNNKKNKQCWKKARADGIKFEYSEWREL